MSDEWLDDLRPFGTDWQKPFLETAPWLVVVFKRAYELEADGTKHQNYYVNESVGIATGFLLAAAHHAGLGHLDPHAQPDELPDPGAGDGRTTNDRSCLIPMGYPAEGCLVPDLQRKPLEEVLVPFR